jgi:hypothetical protein
LVLGGGVSGQKILRSKDPKIQSEKAGKYLAPNLNEVQIEAFALE